jgi:hypothetical protein
MLVFDRKFYIFCLAQWIQCRIGHSRTGIQYLYRVQKSPGESALHCKWKGGENPIWMSGSRLCIPRNEIVQPPYFQNRIIMFYLPFLTLIYICERIIYFQDPSVYFLQPNMWTDPGNIYITHKHLNVEIGTEAVQFPEKVYINGIFLAVCTCWQ